MKMNKKMIYATMAIVLVIAGLTVTYAAFSIYSNSVVVVVVEETPIATLSSNATGSVLVGATVVLNGTVTRASVGLDGITVKLLDGVTVVASTTTDSIGKFAFSWTATTTGTHIFQVNAVDT